MNLYLEMPIVAICMCVLMLLSLHLTLWVWLAMKELDEVKYDLVENEEHKLNLKKQGKTC